MTRPALLSRDRDAHTNAVLQSPEKTRKGVIRAVSSCDPDSPAFRERWRAFFGRLTQWKPNRRMKDQSPNLPRRASDTENTETTLLHTNTSLARSFSYSHRRSLSPQNNRKNKDRFSSSSARQLMLREDASMDLLAPELENLPSASENLPSARPTEAMAENTPPEEVKESSSAFIALPGTVEALPQQNCERLPSLHTSTLFSSQFALGGTPNNNSGSGSGGGFSMENSYDGANSKSSWGAMQHSIVSHMDDYQHQSGGNNSANDSLNGSADWSLGGPHHRPHTRATRRASRLRGNPHSGASSSSNQPTSSASSSLSPHYQQQWTSAGDLEDDFGMLQVAYSVGPSHYEPYQTKLRDEEELGDVNNEELTMYSEPRSRRASQSSLASSGRSFQGSWAFAHLSLESVTEASMLEVYEAATRRQYQNRRGSTGPPVSEIETMTMATPDANHQNEAHSPPSNGLDFNTHTPRNGHGRNVRSSFHIRQSLNSDAFMSVVTEEHTDFDATEVTELGDSRFVFSGQSPGPARKGSMSKVETPLVDSEDPELKTSQDTIPLTKYGLRLENDDDDAKDHTFEDLDSSMDLSNVEVKEIVQPNRPNHHSSSMHDSLISLLGESDPALMGLLAVASPVSTTKSSAVSGSGAPPVSPTSAVPSLDEESVTRNSDMVEGSEGKDNSNLVVVGDKDDDKKVGGGEVSGANSLTSDAQDDMECAAEHDDMATSTVDQLNTTSTPKASAETRILEPSSPSPTSAQDVDVQDNKETVPCETTSPVCPPCNEQVDASGADDD